MAGCWGFTSRSPESLQPPQLSPPRRATGVPLASRVAPSRRANSSHSQVSASPVLSSHPSLPRRLPRPPPRHCRGGQRPGAPRTPSHSPPQAAAADSRRRRAADARARRWAPAPEHPLRAHWVRRRGREGKRGGLADSLADPGSCP